jgi:hypothetical protein
VRAYHIGRYVDPNHPETMCEQHPVYRLEVSSRWNLHPGPLNTVNVLNPPPDAAVTPLLTNDVLAAEMNRQRETTARVMLEAAKLAQSYGELQSVLGEVKNVARNNAFLNVRLATNEQRVVEFGKELQKLLTPPSAATNDVPAFVPGSTDSPKP